MPHAAAKPLISFPAPALAGSALIPGDKSISHRALMLGALAEGCTLVDGLLEGEDVLRTAEAMRRLGASVSRRPDGVWQLVGRGIGGLQEPDDVLDMGNAGTGARLLMGLVTPYPITCLFTGDASLRGRPMTRVALPLESMGARFYGRAGGLLPMAVVGTGSPQSIDYTLPVASAQVKSAILLAGLNTPGITTVIEPHATRDHTEVMLAGFGATLAVETLPGGGRAIHLSGRPRLEGRAITVPADPSSAAFPLVAALIVPGSQVVLPGVGVNPLRTGLLQTLDEMGADLTISGLRQQAGEAVADLSIRHGPLRAVDVPAERAPSMIDEYPILAVAAAFASGTSRLRGLGELRVTESDRLGAMARGLAACGVAPVIDGDDLIITGNGRPPRGEAVIAVNLDHRIAMAFLVMGMAAQYPIGVDDGAAIDTSFPGFVALMNGLGACIEAGGRVR